MNAVTAILVTSAIIGLIILVLVFAEFIENLANWILGSLVVLLPVAGIVGGIILIIQAINNDVAGLGVLGTVIVGVSGLVLYILIIVWKDG